jgi:gliding motility-associated-like protein
MTSSRACLDKKSANRSSSAYFSAQDCRTASKSGSFLLICTFQSFLRTRLMLRRFYLPFTLVVTIVASLCASAQDFSNKGKEFWLAYCYHVGMTTAGGAPTMTLYITSDIATTFTVEIYGGPVLQTGSISAGQVVAVTIPPTTYFINDEGTFTNKAIHVTAAKPVVVYSYITRSAASGATLCLPTSVLGKEYYSMNFTQVSNEPNSYSYLTIVAVEDNTTVEITPAAQTKNGWLANTLHTVTLNKGQIYQVLGALNAGTNTGQDLTGSFVKSVSSGTGGCKRIAVFSGSGKIRIPAACSNNSSDNLYQQLYPITSWGRKYLTVPSYNNPHNYYRIAKSNPAANVYVNGVLISPAAFTNGVWYQFFNNIPNLIESDLPISVAQYFTTQDCDGNGSPYDPDMIVLNPVEQNIDKVTLVSSNLYSAGTKLHHMHVIIRNAGTAISSFKFDGAPVAGWTPHPSDPGYSYVYLGNVAQGFHTLSSDSGFNALAYGYASEESYGYSAGANVKDLYQFISIKNQYATVNFPAGCKNSPFYFSMTFPYQPTQVTWNFFGLFPNITMTLPAYDSTWVVNGRQLYKYNLPTAYTIPNSGSYPVQILAQNPTADGCSGEQQIDYDLQILDPPTANFSVTTNGCLTDSVHFLGQENTGGRSVTKYSWSFGDGAFSSSENPAHLYVTPNNYSVRYAVITDIGCLSDTAQQTVAVYSPPVAKFSLPGPTCEDEVLTFTDQSTASTGSSIAKWTWNFGDGSTAVVASNGSPQAHTYTSYANYTASLVVESPTGCKSVPFTQPLTIAPKPSSSFNFGGACLPTGAAQFTDQSSAATGNIAQWQWDFGDGSTSSLQNPVHNYLSTGPFNVSLKVISDKGCTDDTVRIMNKILAQPKAAFSSVAEVCIGATINFTDQSTATGSTITQWQWDFGDGTTSTLENPTKTYVLPNMYTVTLTTKSAEGCLSTIATRNVVVDALPTAAFSASSPSCVNQNITFTDVSVANAGNLTNWSWDFGDGKNSDFVSANPFTHSYSSPGPYNVTLKVQTNKGCTSTVLSKQVLINPLPSVNFKLPITCVNDPFSQFLDSSSISDGSQNSFTYQWNFGDANATGGNPNTSTLKSPQHKYTAAGTYTVTETVISNNGCSSSANKEFVVNGVPVALFALQGGTTACSGSAIKLTDNSTVNPGNVMNIEIYWDYANDPTLKTIDNSPAPGKIYSHSYSEFGAPASKTVTIHYVVYSGQTCVQSVDKSITLLATPIIQFDALQGICANAPAFQITQASVTNGLTGTGGFTGPGTSPGGLFNPASAGAGTQTIRYTYTVGNGCSNYAEQTIDVYPVPMANAGPDKFVLDGGSVTLTPAVNAGYPVNYLWNPSTWLDNAQSPTPRSAPQNDITYTLTVTSDKGCSSSDNVTVKLLKKPAIPNIFSPNNDGIHDQWEIPGLASYPGCIVDVYNRYGQLIYHSVGYDKPWDGTVNGKPVPVGTYYYIINPKNGREKISGYVDVIR